MIISIREVKFVLTKEDSKELIEKVQNYWKKNPKEPEMYLEIDVDEHLCDLLPSRNSRYHEG